MNALVGNKFERNVPVLYDNNPDFDRHWNSFQSLLDCHSLGRTAVRPIDALNYYKLRLPSGSIRLMIYETMYEQANAAGRLPNHAVAVFDEIKARLKEAIVETLFVKQDRLDKEFEVLSMGNKSHA